MTIDEAIELLKNQVRPCDPIVHREAYDAIALGIKALERFQGLRDAGNYVGMPRLKGETK